MTPISGYAIFLTGFIFLSNLAIIFKSYPEVDKLLSKCMLLNTLGFKSLFNPKLNLKE